MRVRDKERWGGGWWGRVEVGMRVGEKKHFIIYNIYIILLI